MNKETDFKYSFEKKAKVMEMESKEMKQYEEYFDKNILPNIRKVERRKVLAREEAYKIRISACLNISKRPCK